MSYFKQISLNLIQSFERRWLNGLEIKYYDGVRIHIMDGVKFGRFTGDMKVHYRL